MEQYKPSLFTTDKVEGYGFFRNGDKFVLLSQNKINAVNLDHYRISNIKNYQILYQFTVCYYSICCVVSFGGIILLCIYFLLIALSDFLDGFIARYFKVQSELGSYLDAMLIKHS